MAVSIHGNNGVVTTNGTAAAPSLAAPDTDTGLYFDTNTIKATTAGSERLRIDSSGRLGLGQATPVAKLHISESGSNTINIQLTNATTGHTHGTDGMTIGYSSSSSVGFINVAESGSGFTIKTGGTGTAHERLRITPDGPHLLLGGTDDVNEITESSSNAGMVIGGTGFGNGGLAIINSTSGTGRIYFGDAVTNSADRNRGQINYYHNGDYMMFATAGDERLRITSAGKVAIGNASPQQLLHVWPDTANTTSAYVRVTAGDRNSGTGLDIGHDASGNGHVNMVSNGTLTFSTLNSGRIKIANNSAATSIGGAMTFNAMLTVQGDISGGLLSLKASENTTRLMVSGTDSNGVEVNLYDGAGGQRGILGVSSTDFFIKAPNSSAPMTFWTHNGSALAEKLRINTSGRIDIKGDSGNDGFTLSNAYGQAGLFGGMYYNGSSWVRNATSGRKGAGVVAYTGGHIAILTAPESSGTTATMTEKAKFENDGAFRVSNSDQSNDSALNVYKSAGDNTNKAIIRVGYDESNSFRVYRTRADSTYYMEAGQSGAAISVRMNNGGSIGEKARIDAVGYVHMHKNAFCKMFLNSTGTQTIGQGPFQFTMADGTYNSFNIGGHYKTSGTDAWKFVCPVAGYYHFHFQSISQQNITNAWMAIRRNGSYVNRTHWTQGGNWDQQIMQTVISANSGDKVDFYNHQSCSFYGTEWTWMTIMKIA